MAPLLDLPPDDPDLRAHRERVRAAFAGLLAWRRRVLWPLYGAAVAGTTLLALALLVAAPRVPLHWAALPLLAAQVALLALSGARTARALRVEAPYEVEHALAKALAAFRAARRGEVTTLRVWSGPLGLLQSLGIALGVVLSVQGSPLLAAGAFFTAALGYAGGLLVLDRLDRLEAEAVAEGIASLDADAVREVSHPKRVMLTGLALTLLALGVLYLYRPVWT